MQGQVEQQLLETGRWEDIDVLKVAHHGSEGSSTSAFLSVVRPEIAVISVGDGNRYGHPHFPTLERLEDVGAEVHRTDLEGTVRIWTDGDRVRVLSGE